MDPSHVVHDPAVPIPTTHAATSHRVCVSCYEELNATVPTIMQRTTSLERIVVAQERLSIPSPTRRQQSSSQLSDLTECPVCNENLEDLGPSSVQQLHVKQCLDGGAGTSTQSARYLVYVLPEGSPLVGVECGLIYVRSRCLADGALPTGVICLEEFKEGSMIARLSCLCSFHNSKTCTHFTHRSSEWPLSNGTRVLTCAFLTFQRVCRRGCNVGEIVQCTLAKMCHQNSSGPTRPPSLMIMTILHDRCFTG